MTKYYVQRDGVRSDLLNADGSLSGRIFLGPRKVWHFIDLMGRVSKLKKDFHKSLAMLEPKATWSEQLTL